MILIKNVDIYSPKHLGKKDVLICGEKIILIEKNMKVKTLKKSEKKDYNVKGL